MTTWFTSYGIQTDQHDVQDSYSSSSTQRDSYDKQVRCQIISYKPRSS